MKKFFSFKLMQFISNLSNISNHLGGDDLRSPFPIRFREDFPLNIHLVTHNSEQQTPIGEKTFFKLFKSEFPVKILIEDGEDMMDLV